MKFVCDSCHAQYMISDEKVGPNGVIVRCKKCQNKIVVKRAAEPPPEREEATIVASNPMVSAAVAAAQAAAAAPHTDENPIPEGEKAGSGGGGIDDELGRAFESVLAKQPGQDSPSSSAPTQGEMPAASAPTEGLPFPPAAGSSPDPSISGAFAAAAANAPAAQGGSFFGDDEDDSDRQSTRVVNLSSMASMIKAEAQSEAAALSAPPPAAFEEEKPREKPKERKNGTNGSAATAPAAGEWFVAINDNQVGPLTVDGVGEKWEKGELSADSLCWKAGMPDWKPLSSVPELAEKLAPRPAPISEKEAPAGAMALGAQAPAPTPLPPQQEEPGEPEWKPSAASALESLVKDEIEAFSKPPEKKEEPLPSMAEAPRRSSGGLMDDLPDLGAPAAAAAAGEDPHSQATLPLSSRRVADLDIPSEDEPAAPAAPVPERRVSRPPAQRISRPPAYPEEESPAPTFMPPPKSNLPLIIGGGIGGVLLICITIVAVVVLTRQPAQVVVQPTVPPNAVAVATPTPTPTANPIPPPAANPTATPTPTPAPAPDKVEVKTPDKPEDKPADKVEKPAEPPKVEAKAPDKPAPAPREPRPAPAEPKVARAPPPPREPKETKPAKDPEDTGPAVTKPSKNQVDDDFDKIFGGSGGGPAKAPAEGAGEAPKKSAPKTVYIPPAPGTGAVGKAKLDQSDIMSVVVDNKGMIKKCVDETKAKDPGATGTVVMRWVILPNGATSNIQTVTEEFRKTPLSACLAAGIKAFKFPAYSGPQMDPVNFPFKF